MSRYLSDPVPLNETKLFTSTPKPGSYDASLDMNLLQQSVDTYFDESDELTDSLSSNDSSSTEGRDMIIEEFQILPSRVWKHKYVIEIYILNYQVL